MNKHSCDCAAGDDYNIDVGAAHEVTVAVTVADGMFHIVRLASSPMLILKTVNRHLKTVASIGHC